MKYILYEGRNINDNDLGGEFRKKELALKAFKKSTYPYAVVHAYNISEYGDEDYTDTIAEKQEVA